ncbi:MAG: arginine N-succinyltransferase [Deltaproteobacteria bacterium]|nr:arginine N-succinyltransferase [Deltaproteobacteria bacterium]
MILLREASERDIDGLDALSTIAAERHPGFLNIANDRDQWRDKIRVSIDSFAEKLHDKMACKYIFVAEDLEKKRISGVSMVAAQHGTDDSPHFFFEVSNEQKFSAEIQETRAGRAAAAAHEKRQVAALGSRRSSIHEHGLHRSRHPELEEQGVHLLALPHRKNLRHLPSRRCPQRDRQGQQGHRAGHAHAEEDRVPVPQPGRPVRRRPAPHGQRGRDPADQASQEPDLLRRASACGRGARERSCNSAPAVAF